MKRLKNFDWDTFQFKEYLKKTIIENSEASDYEEAVKEWEIESGCHIDTDNKKEPEFLYKICNTKTGSLLFPLEAKTIRSFNIESLTDLITLFETLYKMQKKKEQGKDLEYTDLNRITLAYLYKDANIFTPTKYNKENGANDYMFIYQLLVSEKEPTPAQERKFGALAQNNIKPFLTKLNIIKNTPTIEEEELTKIEKED